MSDIRRQIFCIIFFVLTAVCNLYAQNSRIYVRVNQLGYLPNDDKIALAFSHQKHRIRYAIVDAKTGKRVWGPAIIEKNGGSFGNFKFHYELDFSAFQKPGYYKVKILNGGPVSLPFHIGADIYTGMPSKILQYLRQQRCGYNPFLDQVGHMKDGRTMYGPMPDSTYINVTGGWHDAGDDLKYLMTSSNTVGRLLFSYRENPGVFRDSVDALGHPVPNGIPDVLDEAKWGLDWMLKMHPKPDQLFSQVGDDRDHIGWKMPYADSSDYGWGPESYRVVYYATGKPQGLGKFKTKSDGIANLAGRYAAVMAMAAHIWEKSLKDTVTARRFLRAAKQVYAMGLKQPGHEEGIPYSARYRYHEITWADDMEWGATELYKMTHINRYLKQAKEYAKRAGSTSWMGRDSTKHYEFYPFMNLGHYELYPLVDKAFKDTLAQYYRIGLQTVYAKAKKNPYAVGFPFVWCSNNRASALINQEILYEKMTGDTTYRRMALAVRDWLLGRNPWGVSQFIGVGTRFPTEPQSSVAILTHRQITGGMVDGPVYTSLYKQFSRIRLNKPDKLAPFQSNYIVYHDEWNDFSTNEPTLDGTAEAMVWVSYNAAGKMK
ncbi:MAG TPA: glycoside hydrolase family 9 protein [Balneolaceae bacterium]|nr:glycoside hydrolase family 9 protein [Balneolaceae bacterium]